jgi:hypothetical protein
MGLVFVMLSLHEMNSYRGGYAHLCVSSLELFSRFRGTVLKVVRQIYIKIKFNFVNFLRCGLLYRKLTHYKRLNFIKITNL